MRKTEGFIALISILIIGALALLISIGISLRSIGESNMSLNEEMSNKAVNLANACAEDALLKLKNDLNYPGNEHIIIEGNYSCDTLPLEGSGNFNRTIKTKSTVNGHTRKIKVMVSEVSPVVKISSWEEVADF